MRGGYIRRWYGWIPLVMAAAGFLLLAGGTLGAWALRVWWPKANLDGVLEILAFSMLAMLLLQVVTLFWGAWVIPVLAAGDAKMPFLPTPRRYLRTLLFTVFGPAIIVGSLCSLVVVVPTLADSIDAGGLRLRQPSFILCPYPGLPLCSRSSAGS